MQELSSVAKFHFAPPSRFTSLDHVVGAGEQPMPVHQRRSNVGRGVPRTAIAPTTSSQNGSTPNGFDIPSPPILEYRHVKDSVQFVCAVRVTRFMERAEITRP